MYAFVSEGAQCPGLPEGSHAKTYDCIMVEGTPCMMTLIPEICAGTVHPDYPDWGPLVWISGTCYCPYTLQDKCYGKYDSCPAAKCEGNTLKYDGSCDPKTGGCTYDSENCPGGCDSTAFECKPKPAEQPPPPVSPPAPSTDYCAGVRCPNICESDYLYTNGECNRASGECEYDYDSCPSSYVCDSAGTKCVKEQAPQTFTEICYDGIDNDANGQIDCQDDACTNNPVCGPLKGRVYFQDVEAGQRLLKRVLVTLRWTSASGANMEIAKPVYTDEIGEFSIDDSDVHAPGVTNVMLVGRLYDFDNQIEVTDSGTPVEQFRPIIMSEWAAGAPHDIDFTAYNENDQSHPQDDAKIYYHSKEYVDWANTLYGKLGATRGISPERSDAYNDRNGLDAAWHTRHGNAQAGIYYGSLASSFEAMEAPGNREYHEYSHHFMNDYFGGMPPKHYFSNGAAADINHDGIINHCSSDSWTEGFAEFTSLIVQQQTKAPKRCGTASYAYCVGSGFKNIESNWKPWSSNHSEELAVAGILWDLYDSADINNDGAADDDTVSVPIDTLWDTLLSQRTFPKRYDDDVSPRRIWYVQDLYDALSADKVAPQPGIDKIFEMHGFSYTAVVNGVKVRHYGAMVDQKDTTMVRY